MSDTSESRDARPGRGDGQFTVAHLFADHGVECEVLSRLGYVVRFTIDPKPSPFDDQTVQIDLMERMPTGVFDLAVLHPNCGDVADLTSISGDRDEQEFQIERAREIAQRIAEDYIIENKPREELRGPVVLNGRMFGLPIKYERAFETSFPVKSPPRERELGEKTVTPYYYSDRSIEWWKQVKGYSGNYPKQHLAKNAVPAVYLETVLRSWLETKGQDAAEPQDNNSPAPRKIDDDQQRLVTDGGRPSDEIGSRIKHCTHCGQDFDIAGVEDFAQVLEHWARDHADSEIFWNVVNDYRTHTRCGCCGEMFHSEITASHRGLCVDMYCPDCCEGELEKTAKSLMIDDVTGRYVLDNSEEIQQRNSEEDDGTDATAQLFDLFDEVGR